MQDCLSSITVTIAKTDSQFILERNVGLSAIIGVCATKHTVE